MFFLTVYGMVNLVAALEVVERLERLNRSVVIGPVQPGLLLRGGEGRTIDIWWGGLQHNGDLMLLLAHPLTRNPEWRQATIRVLSVASNELIKQNTERYLAKFLPEIRISAEARVMLPPAGKTVRQMIHQESADTDLLFLALSGPESREQMSPCAERIIDLSEGLRTVFFVKNSSPFVGKLIQTTDELPPPCGTTRTRVTGIARPGG